MRRSRRRRSSCSLMDVKPSDARPHNHIRSRTLTALLGSVRFGPFRSSIVFRWSSGVPSHPNQRAAANTRCATFVTRSGGGITVVSPLQLAQALRSLLAVLHVIGQRT